MITGKVTLDTVVFRLTEENIGWAREAHGLPESFGIGDGLIRVTVHLSVPDVMAYARWYPVLKAHLVPEIIAETLSLRERMTVSCATALYREVQGA